MLITIYLNIHLVSNIVARYFSSCILIGGAFEAHNFLQQYNKRTRNCYKIIWLAKCSEIFVWIISSIKLIIYLIYCNFTLNYLFFFTERPLVYKRSASPWGHTMLPHLVSLLYKTKMNLFYHPSL